jgi:hypothetical protein
MVAGLALVLASCGSSDRATTATSSSTATTNQSSTTIKTGTRATTTTASEPPPIEGTGVAGRVTAGPTCPVERPDQPCPPNPVAGRVEAIDAAGHTAGSAPTDSVGRYAIRLEPGDYTLRVATAGRFPVCPETAVSVPAGPAVTIDIGCDTGIR